VGVRGGRRRRVPVAIELGLGGSQWRVAADEVSGLLGQHHHRGVDVSVRNVGHRGGVHDAQPLDAVDAHALRVEDGVRPSAHLARAGRVQRSFAVLGYPVENLLVGFDGRAGRDLTVVEGVKRLLGEDLARAADGLDPLADPVQWTNN